MRFGAGVHLGPYRIDAPLGAGGMGEVYRAVDSRLNRPVAIKILPSHLADDPRRRKRFEQEAQVISSLTHPHICALYDFGHDRVSESGTAEPVIDFLVMEYLEGETIAERLARRRLSLAQALRYGVQIADALAAAHQQGITHRDLKPGNIMLTGDNVKLLDFGVARLRRPEEPDQIGTEGDRSDVLTAEGAILGTLYYMAPEQLEGRDADPRTDRFAFGLVLYEMICGRRAFEGASRANVIAAILERDPPPVATDQIVPPALERLIRRCLAKNPGDRWQSTDDLASELRWIAENQQAAAPMTSSSRSRLGLMAGVAATIALLIAVVFSVVWLRSPRDAARLVRFQIAPPDDVVFFDAAAGVALSPDGRHLLFVAQTRDASRLLWIQSLDSLTARPLAGTEGALQPFWSYDSQSVGFFADGKLKKLFITGGTPESLCDAPRTHGGAWNQNDVILFAGDRQTGLSRIPAVGGKPELVRALDRESELAMGWPHFLPDGRHFLYRVKSARPDRTGVFVGSLDSAESERLLSLDSNVAYTLPGYLLFHRDTDLLAQRFDAGTRHLIGDPVRVAEGLLASTVNGAATFSASRSGILAYRAEGESWLEWLARDGRSLGVVGPAGRFREPAIAPGGQRIAVTRMDPDVATSDIWIIDSVNGAASRLTFEPARDKNPVWSPDDKHVLFSSDRSGLFDLYSKSVDGGGQDKTILTSASNKEALDWSADGRFVLFQDESFLSVLPLLAAPIRQEALRTSYDGVQGRLSPDGQWIAYVAEDSARSMSERAVYLQPFEASASPQRISVGPGIEPAWRGDGKELFYLAPDGKLMAVAVKASPTLHTAAPRALFQTTAAFISSTVAGRNQYAVTADGQRFLFVTRATRSRPITVVLDWFAGR